MRDKIISSASKVKRKKKLIKIIKLSLLIFMLILLILYVVMGVIYNSGNFSISLDKNLYFKRSLVIYDDKDYKLFRTELYAKTVEHFDNIHYKWLPKNLDESEGGSHNGDNYVAYTFFIENFGDKITDYWSEIVIEDVVKRLDEAIRIRVYKNGESKTYAKLSARETAEKDTIPFESDELIVSDHVESFKPGDVNKYTIVIWLEGSDPECTDNILGGEIKIQMNFNSEFMEK